MANIDTRQVITNKLVLTQHSTDGVVDNASTFYQLCRFIYVLALLIRSYMHYDLSGDFFYFFFLNFFIYIFFLHAL